MASPILFAGGEDLDFLPINSAFASTGPMLIDTTAGHFRSGYARHALNMVTQKAANTLAITTPSLGNISSFWFTGRIYSTNPGAASQASALPWQILDSAGVVRLRIRNTSTASNNSSSAGPFAIETGNAAGSFVQLGSNTTAGFTSGGGAPDKLDVFVNYATSGQVSVYVNGNLIFSFAGDVTTNGATTLDTIRFGMVAWSPFTGSSFNNAWSEIIVASRDTRAMGLVTQTATALGNADTFTTGAVANVNANQAQDASPDFSSVAGQVQQYKSTPAPPAGSFSVVSVVQHARCAIGATGPSKIDFMMRTGGADFLSADLVPGAAWGLLASNWDTNPNTGNPWATGDFPANSIAFNFGYKSVA